MKSTCFTDLLNHFDDTFLILYITNEQNKLQFVDRLLGVLYIFYLTHQFNFNILDLEAQNDGPNETEDETRVAICYVLSSDTF